MKKLLLLLCAIVITSIGFAQQPNLVNGQENYVSIKSADGTSITKQDNDPRITHGQRGAFTPTILWSEDFSAGIPAGWTNVGTINAGTGDTSLWEYRGPNTNPDTSVGTRGNYGNNRRINSPTRSNGWVIFDSDYQDNGGIPGNDGFGPVPAPHFGNLITDVINLTGEPNVKLEMTQHMRYFACVTDIFVSIDGGATWLPDTIQLNRQIARNSSNDDDEFTSIDLGSMAGGQANVKLRFEFNSFTLSNGLSGYYFWQLDDIRIIRTPDNDLVLEHIDVNQGNNTVNYGFIPMNQIVPTTWGAGYLNDGLVTQPNTKFSVDITTGPYNKSSIPTDLAPGVVRDDSINASGDAWTPSSKGTFDITVSVSSDSTITGNEYMPENNSMMRTIFITDSTYSADRDNITGSLGTASFTGAADDYRMANLIEMNADDTITSVYVGIRTSRTVPGGTIRVTIRDTTGGDYASDFPVIVCESDFHIVTQVDTGLGYIVLPIPEVLNGTPQSRTLKAGGWYYVSVEMFSSNNTSDIYIWDDGSVTQNWWASIIYIPGDRWYSNGEAFHIRANFGDKLVGIEENLDVDFQIFPNPASEYANLQLVTQSAADFHVVITNISGQIMKQEYFANTAVINTNLDVSDLASGIYFVQVTSENKVMTKKLVINR
jgi:Secretion system C-terminal sorting domain